MSEQLNWLECQSSKLEVAGSWPVSDSKHDFLNQIIRQRTAKLILHISYNFRFYKETRQCQRGKIISTKRYLISLMIVFGLITRVHQQFLWFNNEVCNTLKEWVQIPKMYSVSRPCSEEVITPFFQDGISGALPDWATIPT